MNSIANNILLIQSEMPEGVKLVAVSKTKPNSAIQEAFDAGQRIFGENKVQDLVKKAEEMSSEIEWHFIGHLQTNKVKFIAPFVSLLHAVDSWKLLKEINKQAKKNNRIISCLLQFHIATEETKFGLDLKGVREILLHPDFSNLKNVQIIGVMGMASYTDDKSQIKKEFSNLKSVFLQLKSEHFKSSNQFKEISMGMSGDYKLAIEQGSTMVRIGSSIFGARQ